MTEAQALENDDARADDAQEDAPDDMRAALNAAIEEHETAPDDAQDDAPVPDAQDAPAKPETAEDPARVDAQADAQNDAPPAQDDAPAPKRAVNTSKPPVGWKGDARDAWGEIPDAVKETIAERERGIAMTLQQTADARRVAQQFSQTMTQHKNTLQSLGYTDPIQGVSQIMNNVAALKNGSAEQRAQAAAGIIRDFGIDVSMLDDVLANQGITGGDASTTNLEHLIDQRMAPVQQLMSQLEASQYQQAQQTQAAANNEVEQFMAGKEYGAQVRNAMADMLDLAASRGQQMSLDEAYNAACMYDPTIRQAIVTNEREAQAAQAREQAQAKRAASSTISGTEAGIGGGKQPESITDALNEAWDLHMRG